MCFARWVEYRYSNNSCIKYVFSKFSVKFYGFFNNEWVNFKTYNENGISFVKTQIIFLYNKSLKKSKGT